MALSLEVDYHSDDKACRADDCSTVCLSGVSGLVRH